MVAAAPELHIIAPTLLGPLPRGAFQTQVEGVRPSALETLLTRGRLSRCRQSGELSAVLAGLLGLESLPVGPVALLGMGGDPGESYWFRAAPIHLYPDRDRLLLLAGAQLQPREDEARILIDEFNALFQEDDLELVAQGGAWFLRTPHEPAIQTQPLERVCGRYMDEYLPVGPQARTWIAFLNEAQMLLHSSAVNRRREARGELPINGLWLWGGGYLPRCKKYSLIEAVYADAAEACGVAKLLGIKALLPAAKRLAQIKTTGGPTLAVWLRSQAALVQGDIDQWWQALAAFEESWAADALVALRTGAWRAVHLYPGSGQSWRITAADLRRFWRRRRAFTHWVTEEQM
ncbi:hypothetical protein [Nitrococcus mobilis]|uniref:Regulatory protein, RpfE type n=1 Tax=Nitrococcus mobilis Nb-231 TaxID=314278 RepID=A4BS56_9GAMM|nr:hypothetical protein [Nitrococcus mobilis]EAR21535.1 hypothetical protein NB231_01454 [Nitrococcus mobilis Nb-231]